jgi:hypothetical protein
MLASNPRPAKSRTARGASPDEAAAARGDRAAIAPIGDRARMRGDYQPQMVRSVISIGTEYCAAKPSSVPPQD